jgi:D-alanyl-D-alanine carboxypeptidase
MHPRGWDVGRRVALTTACAVVLAACGQAREAAPPEPEFTTGWRAEPTVVETQDRTDGPGGDRGGEGDEVLPDDVEADADEVAVERMVIIDDAGNAAPNLSGWATFDQVLSDRLLPANAAASVAVMIDGQVVHAAAYGERVPGSGDPVETTDRFRIASISKTITAIVTLQLVEDGVLTLDDPVGDVLIEHLSLTGFDPDVRSITVRELLSHTAGFPKHQSTFFGSGATSCVDAARIGLSRSVASGSGYTYSNMGFCVLGILIEAVTGKTYERVVYERLLTPLGISGMRMPSTYDLGPDEVVHAASPGRNFMETLGAAGSWNATPTDLVRILNSIDYATPGWKAVSEETANAMRYRIPTGFPPGGYGLGLINYDTSFGHTGTIQNTHAMVLRQPDGITWAVTVSGDYPSDSSNLRGIVRSAFASSFPGV